MGDRNVGESIAMKRLLKLAAAIALLLSIALPGAAPAQSGTVTIPVLCYHVVTANPSGRYQLSIAKFQEQMQYLKDNGFTPLAIDDYYKVMTGQMPAPSKPILLTFDDSTADFATNVVPVLQQHGFKATQFAVTGWVNGAGYLTQAQIGSLAASYDIQNHTQTHPRLTSGGYATVYGEIVQASDRIQGWTGKRPEFLAYPYGATNATAQQAASDNGIKMAFTVAGQKSTSAMNFLELPRYTIVSSETLSSFAKKVN